MNEKKIPMRKCVGCNEMKPKQQLIRIVKFNDGTVVFDATHKANGRGAYICNSEECLKKAFSNRGLERSFKCRISDEQKDALLKEVLS